MSTTTFAPPAADDFEGFEFAALIADLDTPARRRRPSRQVEEQTAIRESLGIYRRRTHERRD